MVHSGALPWCGVIRRSFALLTPRRRSLWIEGSGAPVEDSPAAKAVATLAAASGIASTASASASAASSSGASSLPLASASGLANSLVSLVLRLRVAGHLGDQPIWCYVK